MAGPYPNYVSKDEKDARAELEGMELELDPETIERATA